MNDSLQAAKPNRGPLLALLAYLGLMLAAVTLGPDGSLGPPCIFRKLTGIPCPTCGATRMAVAAIHGEWLSALAYNPLVFILLVTGLPCLVVRRCTARRSFPRSTTLHRRVAISAIAVAVITNWIYVLAWQAEFVRPS